jgi:mannosyltransferase
MVTAEKRAQSVLERAVTRTRGSWDPVFVGALAFAIGVGGGGRPSFWGDEAATVTAASRSSGQLWTLLGHIDAVHGLYYLLMNAWCQVVPLTEFSLRVPSSLLIGLAAAGVVVHGRQLSARSFGLSAGVVFALLPVTTWAAVEARSPALSICTAAWLTVLCVVAVRQDRVSTWACYSALLTLTGMANLFAFLIVLPHAVLVRGLAGNRRALTAWVTSSGAAMLATLPFVVLILHQKSQIGWVPPVGPGTLGQIVGDQYFPAVYSDAARASGRPDQEVTAEMAHAAIHAWTLVLPFVFAVLVLVVWAVRNRRTAGAVVGDNIRLIVRTGFAWILGPTTVLVIYSVVRDPVYVPRYLSFTVCGIALLLATCVVVVGRSRRRIAVILAVLALAAVPNYVAQRGPYAKFGADYSMVAGVIAANAQKGDCLSIDTAADAELSTQIKSTKPEVFALLTDPAQPHMGAEEGTLHGSRLSIIHWSHRLAECKVLWTITDRDVSLPQHQRGADVVPGPMLSQRFAYTEPCKYGFRIVERWQFNLSEAVRSVRSGSVTRRPARSH